MRYGVAALAVLSGLAVLAAGRRPAEPEAAPPDAIRAALATLEQAVEEGDVRTALTVISDDFRGMRQTKQSLARSLHDLRRDMDWVLVDVDHYEAVVSRDGRRADVTLWGSLVALQHDGFALEYGMDEPARCSVIFVKEGRAWRIITCRDVPFIYGFRF